MASKYLKSAVFVFLAALALIPQAFAQNPKSERPLERAVLEFKAMGYGAKFAELERIATDARKNGTRPGRADCGDGRIESDLAWLCPPLWMLALMVDNLHHGA
jgi:hypothetical protein